jgi:hypothetical protein
MKEENRKRLFDAIVNNPQLHHVNVFEATPDVETFTLQYRKLPRVRPVPPINPIKLSTLALEA